MTKQPKADKAHIARMIRHHRKKKRWNQTVLGDFVGVSRQTVYQWERARFCPGVLHLYELSKCLGVPFEELLGIPDLGLE